MKSVLNPETTDVQTEKPAALSSSLPKKSGTRYLLFVLFVATLLNGLDSSEFTSASTVIARELHLSISDIGFLASAFTIFLTISVIPVGLWADRARRTRVIAVCLAVWSVATGLTGLMGNFLGLFFTRMFTGVGEAGYMPASNSLVGDFYPEGQRGRVMSWLALATLIGPILGMVFGGVVAGLGYGAWRWAFFITMVPGVLLALAAWRMREPARRQASSLKDQHPRSLHTQNLSVTKPGEVFTQLRSVLRLKSLVYLIIFGVLTAFTATALQAYFPTLLQQQDALGLTSGQAATFSGLALGPTAIIGVLVGGYLADRLNRRYRGANILVCVVSVVCTFPLNIATLVVMVTTHNLGLFLAFIIPAFLFNTLHVGALSAAVLDVTPATIRATAVAVSLFVQRILGTALAPLVIGILAGYLDPAGTHFLHNQAGHDLVFALLCTCPLAFLVAAVMGIMALRSLRKQQAAVE
ncbi:MAG TPA: MFS transporter [Ktedonosporobacter sp.]|jgi:MFS family permease|nr:MFS transporter [Ktedonosporobacter sp.]